MKLVLVMILIYTALLADKVLVNSIGCSDIDAVLGLNKDDAKDSLKLVQYAAKNNCTVLSPKDKIEVLDKEVSHSTHNLVFTLIKLKDTGKQLYVYKKNIFIERSGDKNKLKF